MNLADQPTLPASSSSLWSPSFQGLLWTNWLTAINDNIFRWFVIGVGKDFVQPRDYGYVLMAGTACFVAPYILMASPAGWLADRFSKRNVIIICKFAEIVIMVFGIVALLCQNFYFLLAIVFLLGSQSALFAPAKIGTIPELLDEHRISDGNGFFNLATLTAVIIGMGIGGWLADVTGSKGQEKIWLTASVLIGIATVGTLISLLVRALPAADPKAKFPISIVGGTIRDIISLFGHARLCRVALGIIFFWSIAGIAQINIDAFADEGGSIFETQRTPMLISLILGLGAGSVLAGMASFGRIEVGLVPWGAAGMAVFSVLLSFAPENFIGDELFSLKMLVPCLMLAGLGASAGFVDVPLASYQQFRSPIETRGVILSATNCLAFCGILVMSVVFYGFRYPAFDGSTKNLSPAFTVDSLSELETVMVQQLRTDFAAHWQTSDAGSRPQIDSYLRRVDESIKPVALTELLLEDIAQRRQSREELSLDIYQDQSPASQRRQVKEVYRQSSKLPLLTARQIFLIIGLLTLPVIAYGVWRIPRDVARIFFFWLYHALYRVRVRGLENIPETAGAILVANHTSYLDGASVLILIPRFIRALAWQGNFESWAARKWANFCAVILISGGPKSIARGLKSAVDALKRGELVAIFPEGGISRSCQVRTFRPGMMKILDEVTVPVIPIYIDEMWGSIFSYYGGRAIFKFPNSMRRAISVHIGPPIENPDSIYTIRQAVQRLSAECVPHRNGRFVPPAEMLIRQCKRKRFKSKIVDSTGQQQTGGTVLTRALLLRYLLRKHVIAQDEQHIGVLIPPSVGGVITNLALGLDRRVAVNLNYTLSNDLINYCIKKAGLKHVLTSRKVMQKFGFRLDAEVCYLEELKDKLTTWQKIAGVLLAQLCPTFLLRRVLGLQKIQPNDLMTLVFTSGSTGVPKGVMLSQRNIATNIESIERVVVFRSDDTMVGVLPFFHSFGYTVTLWAAMSCNIRGAYHFSPLDAQQVGELSKQFRATILVSTPTFLRTYLRRCTPEQFKWLDTVVVGAERMPMELSDAFEEKFGVRPTEGYGTTELSPLVSVNVPPSRQTDNFQVDFKDGSVGRPVPNVAAKITDLDSGAELGANQSGMLWIAGPNVMLGYLDEPEMTSEAIVNGWCKTGDVAQIDSDGFIQITGRESRFSKIGGEMVPHVKIEELLTKFVEDASLADDGEPKIAVTAIPDARKGERLIVLHTAINKSPSGLRDDLSAAGLPNLFIPSCDSFRQVDKLPVLGSGKLDLKGIKQMAVQLFAADEIPDGVPQPQKTK